MAFKLFEKKGQQDAVVPSSPTEQNVEANPASIEPKSEATDTANAVPSDTSDGERDEAHQFHGVAEMEAITTHWDKKSMLIAYAL